MSYITAQNYGSRAEMVAAAAARADRKNTAANPAIMISELKKQISALENRVSNLSGELNDTVRAAYGMALDRADLQALIVGQAQRICELEGLSADRIVDGKPSVRSIVDGVLIEHPGYRFEDIISHRRARDLIVVRHKCMAAVYTDRPDLSIPQIGRFFQRDHTTILHAVQKVGVWRGGGTAP